MNIFQHAFETQLIGFDSEDYIPFRFNLVDTGVGSDVSFTSHKWN